MKTFNTVFTVVMLVLWIILILVTWFGDIDLPTKTKIGYTVYDIIFMVLLILNFFLLK